MRDHRKSIANGESRKDRVLKQLTELTAAAVKKLRHSESKIGFSAGTIADALRLLRNNVSMELNFLARQGCAIKLPGKPVLYLAVLPIEKEFGIKISPGINSHAALMAAVRNGWAKTAPDKPDPTGRSMTARRRTSGIFESVIGVDDDLQLQIKQAKAAILYPPNGLHTLLIGPTGSGKTTFAGVMHRFAVESGKLRENAPYVVFNCADYAENAQLLISHLFGHVKGAYTGADRERKGLVEQADGGILFLDEIHRLPPEGQEMLFSLIDRGTYRKLGEAESVRSARVLIIAATTENPQAAILGTFLRRIPLIIALPGIGERPLRARMLLICRFFREESMKIKASLTVSKEVLKVLLLYQCPGNIGQLRNDIQLLCANAFIEYIMSGRDDVQIKLSQLTDRLRDGYFSIDEKRREITRNFNLNDCETIRFSGSESEMDENLREILLYDEYQTGEAFYAFILENARKMYREGCSVDEIKANIGARMQTRLWRGTAKSFNGGGPVDRKALSKIATPEIVEVIERRLKSSRLFGPDIDAKILYSLALHMETLIERIRHGEIAIYPDIARVSAKYPEEYELAQRIQHDVQRHLSLRIPDDEAAFIAVFLHAINAAENGAVQVLVMAHGKSTASNMVEVAKVLLGYECLHALDMPMDSKVEDTLREAIELVRQIHQGSGVLLLVDMGSLTTFSEIISERTGIPTRSVRMVSTPMVIEAARKAVMPQMTLDELEQSVIRMSPFIGERVKVSAIEPSVRMNENGAPRQIVSSGLINMLENILVFLNVKKTYKVLHEIMAAIAADCGQHDDDVIRLKFLFHCSCMLERMIRKEPLPHKRCAKVKREKAALFGIVRKRLEPAEEIFGISVPDTEVAYVVEMLYLHFYPQSSELGLLAETKEISPEKNRYM